MGGRGVGVGVLLMRLMEVTMAARLQLSGTKPEMDAQTFLLRAVEVFNILRVTHFFWSSRLQGR